jgi:cell division protein FtsQ
MKKRAWNIILWLLSFTGTCLLLAFEYAEENSQTVNNIDIELIQPANQLFLNKEDISYLIHKQIDKIIDEPLRTINTHLLEESLENHDFIQDAEVFSTLDGNLSVRVKQKEVIARIIHAQHRYLDAEGNTLPLNKNFTAKVPVITGRTDSVALSQSYEMIQLLQNTPYFESWLAEIHINQNLSMEFVPTRGRHRVIFGNLDQKEEKLKKLQAFYTTMVNESNLKAWRTLNVSYNNMLVSTKYNTSDEQ